jgi:Glutamine synthetase
MHWQDRIRQSALARELQGALADRGVVALGGTWVDNSGVTRVKAVPLGRLESAAAWGIGASPVFDAFLADDWIVAGRYAGGPVGDLRLHPDLSRVVVLAEQPGWAWAPVCVISRTGRASARSAQHRPGGRRPPRRGRVRGAGGVRARMGDIDDGARVHPGRERAGVRVHPR